MTTARPSPAPDRGQSASGCGPRASLSVNDRRNGVAVTFILREAAVPAAGIPALSIEPLGDLSCNQARAAEFRDPLQQPLVVTKLLEAVIRPNSELAWPTAFRCCSAGWRPDGDESLPSGARAIDRLSLGE